MRRGQVEQWWGAQPEPIPFIDQDENVNMSLI